MADINDIKIENLLDLSKTDAASLFDGKAFPFEVLPEIKSYILNVLIPSLDKNEFEQAGENVWIAKTAKVAPSALINGPTVIFPEAEIRHGAFIRGSAVVGRGAVVGNSTELKNCVLFDMVQVPHYNYVGDAVLGFKAHMGAGAITANIKADKSNVIITLLKREWINRFKIFNYTHAYKLIFEYIETFYNTVRIHSHCGYLSPNEYEEQYLKNLETDVTNLAS